MGCNSCRSACEDCSEGGITFRRAVRVAVVEMQKPLADTVPAPSVVLTPADLRLPTEMALQDLVNHAGGAADLGSDPNSASRSTDSKRYFPELGSDPNSAGHRQDVSSSAGQSCNDSVIATLNIAYGAHLARARPEIEPQFCAQPVPPVNRRIGVRAQFGIARPTNTTAEGRIGIRPQICYTAREFEAGLKSRLTDHAAVPLTSGAAE